MRSFKTLAAAAVLAGGVGLAAPAAAHAAATAAGPAAGVKTGDACAAAVAVADKAQAAYDAALDDIKKQREVGGHPGRAEMDNLEHLRQAADAAASEAARICGHAEDASAHHHRHHCPPHGSMHTGTGSTSQGVDGAASGLGAALVGAAGLGMVVSRRRRAREAAESGARS